MVAGGNTGPPGEGWKESSAVLLPLASWQVDLAPVLEGRPSVEAMLEDTLSSTARDNTVFTYTETGQSSDEKIHISVILSVERHDCVSSCAITSCI